MRALAVTASILVDNPEHVIVWLRIMRNQPVTHRSSVVFHVLADPTRRAVLDLLRHGSRPAGEIAHAFPVSRPAISKHLRVLRRASLVCERRHGRHRLYELNPQPLKAVDHWLEKYRAFWEAKLAAVKAFVESEHVRASGSGARKRK